MTEERTIHHAQVERYARIKFPFQVCSKRTGVACAGFRDKAVAEAFILGLRNPGDWYVATPNDYAPPAGPAGPGADES